MAKPFASSADTAEKTETLEILADGVYALTAEGEVPTAVRGLPAWRKRGARPSECVW